MEPILVKNSIVSTTPSKKSSAKRVNTKTYTGIPQDILNDPLLDACIKKSLPINYNFEIKKSLSLFRKHKVTCVALQMPEGLLIFAPVLSQLFLQFAQVQTIILGDVTFGACCIDDYTAKRLGANFIIHYGHSCLIPISNLSIPSMYVFVSIQFDTQHFINVLKHNFKPDQKFVVVSTVQFVPSLYSLIPTLKSMFSKCIIPQEKPLSSGEILGCTSTKFDFSKENNPPDILYLGDGRFHLESIMISNPSLTAYRYDPYLKRLTIEEYDHKSMQSLRKNAIKSAKDPAKKNWGIILGSLGRQGSPILVDQLSLLIKKSGKNVFRFIMSEVTPSTLNLFTKSRNKIDVWVQVSCPRLSIDWGHQFSQPLLSPYEAMVALDKVEWQESYPMDFYSEFGGDWSRGKILSRQRQQVISDMKERIRKRKAKKKARKARKAVNIPLNMS